MSAFEQLKKKSIPYKIFTAVIWGSIVAINLYLYYTSNMPFWANLLDASCLVLIAFYPFYYVAYVIVPALVYQQKIGEFLILIVSLSVVMALLYMAISYTLSAFFYSNGVWAYFQTVGWRAFLLRFGIIFWTYLIPFLIATTLKIMSDRFRMHKKMLQIQQEKNSAELNYLQSQINPHFLFNVLNTIYFQISKQNTKGRDLVYLVSHVLRHQLYEAKAERIEIEKELDYTKNYIEILKYCNQKIEIDVFVDEKLAGFKLAPLLLRSLIDACIRNDETPFENKSSQLKIHFSKSGDSQFLVSVDDQNAADIENLRSEDKSSGILNLKRQLELLYPGKYILRRIDDTDNSIKTTTMVLDYGKN